MTEKAMCFCQACYGKTDGVTRSKLRCTGQICSNYLSQDWIAADCLGVTKKKNWFPIWRELDVPGSTAREREVAGNDGSDPSKRMPIRSLCAVTFIGVLVMARCAAEIEPSGRILRVHGLEGSGTTVSERLQVGEKDVTSGSPRHS